MQRSWKFGMMLGLIAALASCGGGNGGGSSLDSSVSEDKNNLQIMILNRGYGTSWLTKTAEAYEKAHAGTKITIEIVDSTDNITTTLNSGKKRNGYDIFYDVSESQSAALENTYASVDGGLANLDDLYAMTVPGETKTYGDKMNATIKNELDVDGHHYSTSWAASTLGIYYNETVLNNAFGSTWSVPQTSDELIALGKSFVEKGHSNTYTIFIKNLDLLARSIFLSWWSQYEGLVNFQNFWDGKYIDEATGQQYGNDVRIYTQQGRLEALKAIEPLARSDGDKLGYKYAATTQSSQYKSIQSQFYLSKNNYALYPSGDWLEQESATGSDSVVKMMKTPVISSIINNLEDSSIKDDATLSKVVTAIDEGKTAYDGVSAKDFAKIKEARNVTSSMSNFHLAYVPAYSSSLSLAKDFLLFSATDEAINIYKKEVNGGFAPFSTTYDESGFTDTEKSVAAVNKNANYVFYSKKNRLFYIGGALTYSLAGADGGSVMEVALNVQDGIKTRKTAQEYFEGFSNYYANGDWERKVTSKL